MRIGLIGPSASGGNNCYVLKHFSIVSLLLLSVQCNALHGTEYKITCGVCVCVCVCVRARTGFGWRRNISKTVRGSNRKWHIVNRLVTWSMTSRDLERSRSGPPYVWGPLSLKWLEIQTLLQYSTYRKRHLGYQMLLLLLFLYPWE